MDLSKVWCLLFFALTAASLPGEDYTVQKGDTLASVSQKFHLPQETLKALFPDQGWDKLTGGAVLSLPERHVVVAGETLYSLSKKWGVEVSAVIQLNGLPSSGVLKVGMTLAIPPVPTAGAVKGFWPVEATPKKEGGKLQSVSFLTPGSDFFSVSEGTVVFAGEYRGVGRVILVQNPENMLFGYGNFESSTVAYGQKVKKGQNLGKTSSRVNERLVFFVSRLGGAVDPFVAKR